VLQKYSAICVGVRKWRSGDLEQSLLVEPSDRSDGVLPA